MSQQDILLGDGVFAINGTNVAVTKGGGKLSIAREFKVIEADGDYGPVKTRIRMVKETTKLSLMTLEVLTSNLPKFYPGMTLDTSDPNKTVQTSNLTIASTDYQSTVTWTGKTLAGRPVIVTLNNCINLENIEWDLKDKDEVVPEVNYTATYDPNTRTTPPWNIQWYNNGDTIAPSATLSAPKAGARTQLVVTFTETLSATTLAITDITNLLSSLSNDALGTPVAISVATAANSVVWLDATSAAPKALITIPSTTFVAGKTLRLNFKASAVTDLSNNAIAAATNFDTVVTV